MDNLSIQADVVVLGGGLAGHCAALSALEGGASVLMLEKSQQVGGSTASGPGSFAFAGTDIQLQADIKDDNELLRADLIAAAKGCAKPELIDAYVEHQLDTYEWLKQLGVPFTRIEASSNQSVPRSHPLSGREAVALLHAKLTRHDAARVMLGARALKLERHSGRIQRVKFVQDGKSYIAVARFGVVIATGGFAQSDNFLAKFAPELLGCVRMGGSANEGDGLRMAWEHGADIADTAYMTGSYGVSISRYPDLTNKVGTNEILLHPIYKGGIAVNRNGERFVNESLSYKQIGTVSMTQPDGISFQVFDESVMRQSVPKMTPRDFEAAYARGLVRQSNTLAGAAETVGIDPVKLQATVDRYNEMIRSGTGDLDFGRRHVIGSIGDLQPLETPPYYIYPCATGLLATYAGMLIDSHMRVLDVWGDAIEGLYAAGEAIGGFHGASYLSGSSLGKAAVFGRLAGTEAAKRIPYN